MVRPRVRVSGVSLLQLLRKRVEQPACEPGAVRGFVLPSPSFDGTGQHSACSHPCSKHASIALLRWRTDGSHRPGRSAAERWRCAARLRPYSHSKLARAGLLRGRGCTRVGAGGAVTARAGVPEIAQVSRLQKPTRALRNFRLRTGGWAATAGHDAGPLRYSSSRCSPLAEASTPVGACCVAARRLFSLLLPSKERSVA